MIGEKLLAAKGALVSSTLFQKWVRDNPNESARVERYWLLGDVRPATATAFGLNYALMADEYHDLTAEMPFAPI